MIGIDRREPEGGVLSGSHIAVRPRKLCCESQLLVIPIPPVKNTIGKDGEKIGEIGGGGGELQICREMKKSEITEKEITGGLKVTVKPRFPFKPRSGRKQAGPQHRGR